MGAFLRKYGAGTGADVYVPMIKRAVVDFAVGADWTPAAGDVKVTKDGGAAANIGTLPVAVAMGNAALWKFVFADAELQCKVLAVTIADSATKAVEDQAFLLETYGHASAMYIIDLAAAVYPANVTQLLGTAWLAPGTAGTPDVNAKLHGGTAQTGRDIGASVLLSAGSGAGQLDFTAGAVKANLVQILGTVLTESAGLLAASFKKFFNVSAPTGTVNSIPDAVAGAASGLAIVGSNMGSASSVTGAVGSVTGNVGGNVVGSVASVTAGVTVTTNNDKAGYSLSAAGVQAIWDALISALTTVGSIGKLLVDNINATISSRMATYTQPTGFLAATFPGTVASPTNITAGVITTTTNLTTNNDKTGYALTGAYDPAKTASQAGDAMALTSGERTTLTAVMWNALTSGMSTAGSIGKKLADWVVGTIDTYTGNTKQTGDAFLRLGVPVGASLSVDVAAVKAQTAAIDAKTTNLPSDPADQSLVIAATDAVMARLGVPAVSVSADLAAVKGDTAAVKTKTDFLPSAAAGGAGGVAIVGSNMGTVSSVTGNVGGNVVGSVASVTAGVTIAAAAIQAIWDSLTSALTLANSIGKLLVDNINATISSRLASASYTAPDNATISAINAKTTNLPSDPADQSLIIAATDAVMARLGAPAGASHAADMAAVKAETATIQAKTANLPTDPADESILVAAIAAVPGLVFDQTMASHLAAGSTGAALNAAGAAGDPWGTTLPGAYGPGSAGKIIGDNLNATISSRAPAATALSTADYSAGRAAKLDELDAAVSSRASAVTLDAVGVAVGGIKGKTDQLSFTTPNKVDAALNAAGDLPQAAADKVWSSATRALSDKAGFSLAAPYDPAKTAAQAGDAMALTSGERTTLVAAIWNALTSGMSAAASIGKKLADWVLGTPQTGDSYARLGPPAGASVSADLAAVKAQTAAIQGKTDTIPASPAAVGSVMTLSSGERDAIADAHLDRADAIETGLTPRQQMRLSAAADAGKVSGAGTAIVVIRNAVADSKPRITAAVTADGDRTAVTVDVA